MRFELYTWVKVTGALKDHIGQIRAHYTTSRRQLHYVIECFPDHAEVIIGREDRMKLLPITERPTEEQMENAGWL